MTVIVKEEWVHDALEYIRSSVDKAAAAKGNLVRAEYHRQQIRARLILSAPPASNQELRKAWAEAHDEYAEICEKLAVCEEEYERYRNQRNRAETICEMWRTQSATLRGLSKF